MVATTTLNVRNSSEPHAKAWHDRTLRKVRRPQSGGKASPGHGKSRRRLRAAKNMGGRSDTATHPCSSLQVLRQSGVTG